LTASRSRGVIVIHGATAFTVMPERAHSQASARVSWFMAALVMAYTDPVPLLNTPARLDTFTTRAPPGRDDARRRDEKSRQRWKQESTLVQNMRE
jgi:hypothetical protein